MMTGPLSISIDGTEVGRATYHPALGGHIDANLVFSLSRYAVIPGFRVNVGGVTSRSMTFDQNEAALRRLNMASVAFYLSAAF